MDARLKAAIDEAHAAGMAAVKDFVERTWMAKDGVIYDASGCAFVKVRTPSYQFREALKRLNPKAHGLYGAWTVLGFGRQMPREQSITAHEIACKAALNILSAHFPTEEFLVDSHMD
jgi:hypothetical protein